jgi:hypothetical protein
VDRRRLVVVLAEVSLGEMPNTNPLLWIKICGSNHLTRRGLAGVLQEIHEIDLVHVLKSRQSVQFQLIIVLGHLNGRNQFCFYGQVVEDFNIFLWTLGSSS